MKPLKQRTLCMLAVVLATCCLCLPAHAALSSSANYSLEAQALDHGGLKSTSGSHALISAAGQTSPIGVSASSGYKLYAGFINVFRAPRDTDGDGVTDNVENATCMDYQDRDTDDDGIPDGVEDLNRNGIVDPGETDPCDYDTDDDGVSEGTETGLTLDDVDEDTDPLVFQPDLDPSTTTDPLNPDSNGNGNGDGFLDENRNGRIDPWEQPLGLPLAPVADAGPDRAANLYAKTILDGGNSRDLDGAILSWEWAQVGGDVVELAEEEIVSASFTPEHAGAYTFQLTVTDNDGLKSTDTCIVNVPPVDASPPSGRNGPVPGFRVDGDRLGRDGFAE